MSGTISPVRKNRHDTGEKHEAVRERRSATWKNTKGR